MSIFSHISAAVSGFAKGGIGGAVGGLIGGKNTPRTAAMRPKAQQVAVAPSNVSTFSASPYVRLASASTGLVQLPNQGGAVSIPGAGFMTSPPVSGGGGFGGSGATGSYGTAPMWAYRRLYTKRGTPRRTRHDGQPYAVPRMNPMNVRAARRAIRRIRGARKLLQRIERSLPKARTHSRSPRRAA